MTIQMTWPQYLRRECVLDEFTIHLTPQETEVLLLLMLHSPHPVSTTALIEFVWPNPDFEPDTARNGIFAVIRRLRYKLGAHRIEQHNTFGYCLLQHPVQRKPLCPIKNKSLPGTLIARHGLSTSPAATGTSPS